MPAGTTASTRDELVLDGAPLTTAQVEAVARSGVAVRLAPVASRAMDESRSIVQSHLEDGEAHYGINTGFGSLSQQRIGPDQLRELQRNLVRSHAAGVGRPLPTEVVRAMMLLLAASLARARSGVRPLIVERLIGLLNAGVTPVVPEVGSVGASGDLAPLAHVAIVLIGEGEATVRAPGAKRAAQAPAAVPGGQALKAAGVPPLVLEAKEGLALINGTHLMAAQGALACREFDRLFAAAVTAPAMSIDACRATDAFLDERVYQARNQPGPARVAARLRELLEGSRIIPAHRENDPRVQDPYSLRCAAVVLGAAGDAAGYVKHAVDQELGAVTDNPLVFPEDRATDFGSAKSVPAPRSLRSPHPSRRAITAPHPPIVSAGNFHGMPLAIPLDTLPIAVSHIAGIAERRVFAMLAAGDPQNPITPYLSPRPGLHSGLMIAQYTAAACCNEIIGLCTPASVSNISTSAGMEDYNSFGPRSAAKARRALELATRVVAIELICAAEALEYQRPLTSGAGVEKAFAKVREVVPRLTEDRPLAPDIEAVAARIEDADF